MVDDLKYQVSLDNFSGPLDLLLHLIKEKTVDIFTIDLEILTSQFLLYVNNSENPDLEILGDYLVMASYLIEIKSKYLLPKEPINVEDNYEDSNRQQLIKKLLAYKQIKEVSDFFKNHHAEGCKMLSKEKTFLKPLTNNYSEINLSATSFPISTLVNSFNKILQRANDRKILESTLVLTEISPEEIAEKIMVILEANSIDWNLNDLLNNFILSMPVIMACFVAVLDLVRQQKIIIFQSSHFDEIYLRINQ